MSLTGEKTARTRAAARTDEALQQAVQAELHWDTHIPDAAAIGVSVKGSVVTLSGEVASYAEKMAAQEAAHRVAGVRDVADDLTVTYPGRHKRTDSEIAQAVRRALEWDTQVADRNIQSTVEEGWVTLKGSVSRWSQRNDAEKAIRNLSGIRGVTNSIAVASPEPEPDPEAIRRAIEAAIDRQTEREVQHLAITARQGTVTLTGTVRSALEKLAATSAAGFAPGVRHVENNLTVDPYL
jgi:osmotically-inducible protein OsmY